MWSATRTRTALLGLAALLASLSPASSQLVAQNNSEESARHPLFVVRERLHPLLGANCPPGRIVHGFSYSVITVFADGHGTKVVWSIPACSDPATAFEWAVPADGRVQNLALSQAALAQLQTFLDRPEVKQLRDFMNAGPGIGDYDIEIHRVSEVQHIPVVSLMPEHTELKRDPTLLQLICKAKEIGGDERPRWCPNASDPSGAR